MSDESLHRNLHPQLHPLLLEFQGINGEPLRSVWRVYDEGNVDKIVLGFDQESLVVEADPYDDTIAFHLICNENRNTDGWVDGSRSEPWSSLIGEEFGWGWITINQQDALDGILLSFSGIMPRLLLTVVASSIKEHVIAPAF